MALSRHRLRRMAWLPLALFALTATGCQAPPAAADKTPASAAAETTPAGGGKGCPATRASGARVGPAAPPKGVSWKRFHGVAVPGSPALGPQKTTGDIARCYAHSSAGALVAALQIGTRFPLSAQWKAVVEEQTCGDARAGYVKARTAREAAEGKPSGSAPGKMLQPAGFRFESYSDQRAVISLAFKQPGGTLIRANTATVQWRGGSNGDWRFEISRSAGPYQELADLKGYIVWGPQ